MFTLAIFASCLINEAAKPSVDKVFSTNCDVPAVYHTIGNFKPVWEQGSPTSSGVKCVGYTGQGNPGAYFRLQATWQTTKPFEAEASMSSEIWTMSQDDEHVTSIDFSTDYRKTVAARLPQLFLIQGTKTYISEIPSTSTSVNQWISVSKHLTSADFVEIAPNSQHGSPSSPIGFRDTNSHPDFSANAKRIDFRVGLDTFRTTTGSAGSENLDYDNINITVHLAPNV